MAQPIFNGLIKIEISGPDSDTLIFSDIQDGVARFSVVEVVDITILDSRQNTVENIQALLTDGHFKRVLEVLNAPAYADIDKEGNHIQIRLKDVDLGVTHENALYKLRISVKHRGHVPTAKFLMFTGGSHSRKSISYAALFRYT